MREKGEREWRKTHGYGVEYRAVRAVTCRYHSSCGSSNLFVCIPLVVDSLLTYRFILFFVGYRFCLQLTNKCISFCKILASFPRSVSAILGWNHSIRWVFRYQDVCCRRCGHKGEKVASVDLSIAIWLLWLIPKCRSKKQEETDYRSNSRRKCRDHSWHFAFNGISRLLYPIAIFVENNNHSVFIAYVTGDFNSGYSLKWENSEIFTRPIRLYSIALSPLKHLNL